MTHLWSCENESEDEAVCLGLVLDDTTCDHCDEAVGAMRVVVMDRERFGVVYCVACVLSDVDLIREWAEGASDECDGGAGRDGCGAGGGDGSRAPD